MSAEINCKQTFITVILAKIFSIKAMPISKYNLSNDMIVNYKIFDFSKVDNYNNNERNNKNKLIPSLTLYKVLSWRLLELCHDLTLIVVIIGPTG